MTRHNDERLEQHLTEEEIDHRLNAMDILWSDYDTPTKEQLDILLYGERYDDDTSSTRWQTLQDGLAQDKMDDASLATFAVTAAEYARDTRKEILDSDLTDGYQGRDDILAEKMTVVENTLFAHVLETAAERSQYYPFPGEKHNHFDRHDELSRMARRNQWADIPERIRQMHEEAAGGSQNA